MTEWSELFHRLTFGLYHFDALFLILKSRDRDAFYPWIPDFDIVIASQCRWFTGLCIAAVHSDLV